MGGGGGGKGWGREEWLRICGGVGEWGVEGKVLYEGGNGKGVR